MLTRQTGYMVFVVNLKISLWKCIWYDSPSPLQLQRIEENMKNNPKNLSEKEITSFLYQVYFPSSLNVKNDNKADFDK